MTIAEIWLGYEGFLEKLEFQGNVMLMALRQRNVKKAKPIKLRNDNEGKGDTSDWKMSTIEERNDTLSALGIKRGIKDGNSSRIIS